ncbi:MAG TPA: hypothetical protein VK988_23065 [Acidimicrobiales bacterium]|nr:hypothetical protein [Acidimicrobiales bacterium]
MPSEIAELDDAETEFLQGHLEDLHKKLEDIENQRSRFQHGADVEGLLRKLPTASPADFLSITQTFVERLAAAMKTATNPKAGILAVITTGPEKRADRVSVLKLDSDNLSARMRRLKRGNIKLDVFKDLLPKPGDLQKGLSWPGPEDSAAVIQDRNASVAEYFLTAFQLEVSAKASDAEKGLLAEIVRLPLERRKEALAAVGELSGPADAVVVELQQRVPELQAERRALGAGGALAGNIRADKFRNLRLTLSGDNIDIVVPQNRLDQVTDPREVNGRYEVTVTFTAPPRWR